MKKKLFEELTISNEIQLESNGLANAIIVDSKKYATIIKKSIFDNVLKNTFDIKLFGEIYEITYYIFNIETRNINIELFKNLTPITINSENKIELRLLTINDIPDNEYFYGEIYHELTHVYQYIKSKKDVLKNSKVNYLYSLINNIRNAELSDLNILFANAIYASFNFEQDALIHETYGEFMRSDNIYHLNEDIEESNAYKFIEDLRNAIKNIDNLDEELFKNSKKFYLDLFTKQLKRFETKFGKLIIKIKKEFYENQLNEGLIGNFRAFTLILKNDSEEIKKYIDDEVF